MSGKTKNDNGSDQRQIVWKTADEIQDRRPEWAWYYHGGGRLARGTHVLFCGRPDVGKSMATRWFAAGYTLGTIGGCFFNHAQNVAYIANEESLEVIVKPSLRAVGADMSRIHFPEVRVNGQQVPLLSIVDEKALTDDFLAKGITIVIIDPVMSAIKSTADIYRNNETRAYLEPWRRIAEAINGLTIGLAHLIKGPGADIVAAINGSSAFGEVPRAVIAYALDPQAGDGQGVLSQEMNNLGRKDLALTYSIKSTNVETDDGFDAEVGRFVIGESSDRRVSDVIRADKASDRLGERSFDVLDAVRHGPGEVDITTVAGRTGLTNEEARKYLARLAQNGLVVRVSRGVYDWPSRLRDRIRSHIDGGSSGSN
jgi:hypothetical protein